MNQHEKTQYRELLNDICSEYCEQDRYCILKEFLASAHPSPKLLMQIKCIDKFKYERSKAADKDLGWTAAMELWVSEGFAKKFAELYTNDIRFAALYKKIIASS